MINAPKKGYKKEKRCRDELIKDGWFICFKSVRFRFGCIDFAKLFDVCAAKGKIRLYVSVKHFGNSNSYLEHQAAIKQFKEQYGLIGEIFELWLWKSPRWQGRGINKKFFDGEWIKVSL